MKRHSLETTQEILPNSEISFTQSITKYKGAQFILRE